MLAFFLSSAVNTVPVQRCNMIFRGRAISQAKAPISISSVSTFFLCCLRIYVIAAFFTPALRQTLCLLAGFVCTADNGTAQVNRRLF